jgi:hypothetical protein
MNREGKAIFRLPFFFVEVFLLETAFSTALPFDVKGSLKLFY